MKIFSPCFLSIWKLSPVKISKLPWLKRCSCAAAVRTHRERLENPFSDMKAERFAELFGVASTKSFSVKAVDYISLLKCCGNSRRFSYVEASHAQMIVRGLGSDKDSFLGSLLLIAYVKCKSLEYATKVYERLGKPTLAAETSLVACYAQKSMIDKAHELFAKMKERNVISWNSLISGYASHGCEIEALELFHQMILEGIRPSNFSYSIVLGAEANLGLVQHGLQIHGRIVKSGFCWCVVVGNALIDMYAKGGLMEDASLVFEEMSVKDIVTWTAMITGFTRNGDVMTAQNLFEKMGNKNVVSWNAMISGYEQSGHFVEALMIFKRMQNEGNMGNASTYVSVLKACSDLDCGQQIHGRIVKTGIESDLFVGSALIDMYCRCGTLSDAELLFYHMPEKNVVCWSVMVNGYAQDGRIDAAEDLFWRMPERNVVSWNAMISGNAQAGRYDAAVGLFVRMQKEGLVQPDEFTFSSVLSACAGLGFLEVGRHVHALIVVTGSDAHVSVGNALVAFYSKLGNLNEAWTVFNAMPKHDVVSWTTMITACSENGKVDDARCLFDQMPVRNAISWNAMMTGYFQNGRNAEANEIFEHMSNPNLATWNSMITGFSCEDSLNIFSQMHRVGIDPDRSTFTAVLSICTDLGILEMGRQAHAYIIKQNYAGDLHVCNALITLYGNSGNFDDSYNVLSKMLHRDVVSWNAMIAVHSQHGNAGDAIKAFNEMQLCGIKPNQITFIALLSACRHAGLTDEGWFYFQSMKKDYGILQQADHYACMVDLLGRAGRIHDAVELIQEMPFCPDTVTWGALLAACQLHGNVEVGKLAAQKIIELDSENASAYVSLSNMYAFRNMGGWFEIDNDNERKNFRKEPDMYAFRSMGG